MRLSHPISQIETKLANWWRGYPMVVVASAAILGILLADYGAQSLRFWLSSSLFAAALLISPLLDTRRALSRGLLLISLFALLHARQLAQSFEHPVRQHLAEASQSNRSLEAELEAKPLATQASRGELEPTVLWVKRVTFTASGKTFLQQAKVTALLPANGLPQTSGWLTLNGRLRPLQRTANPGQFDPETFALRQGIVAEFALERAAPAVDGGWNWPTLQPLRHLAEACRRSIQQRLALGMEAQADRLTVIQAMVLGASEDTDPRIEESFRRSGTLHVFAVSGLHVGLICVIGWTLLRPLIGLRRYQVVLLLIGLVVCYAYVTGWRPSAARAAIMITVFLCAAIVQRESLLLNGMGFAATLLLTLNTQQLFQVGFQLSFGVLLAILLLAERFQKRLEPWTEFDPFLPPAIATTGQRYWRRGKRYVAGLMAVSLAAWLGSLPLMIYHFHTVTPAALLANCLLIPLAFLCLGTACVSLGASLLPFAAPQLFLNQLCGQFAHWMVIVATGFADLPGASFHLPAPTTTPPLAPLELRWFALPSGGEACLLAAQDHQWLLDCGHLNSFGGVLLPGLRKAGVNRLEGLILSHSDAGHVGAAEEVIRLFDTRRLYHPLHEPWPSESRETKMRRLLQTALPSATRPPRVSPLQRGDVVTFTQKLRPARLTVLYPTRTDRHNTADDRGLVSLIELGALRVLWLADAGFTTETALLNRKEDLRCDILVRGLHASDLSGTYDLLAAAAPKVILSSGTEADSASQLPRSVAQYAADHRIPLWTLPESGSIRLTLEHEGATEATLEAFTSGARHRIPLRQ
jgi:competence protein ComEC